MSDIVPAIQNIYTNMNVPTPKALPGTKGGLGWGTLGRVFGLYETLRPGAQLSDRMIGATSVINPGLGLALSGGAFLGNAYAGVAGPNTSVSSRGSGSQALSGQKQRKKDGQAIASTITGADTVESQKPDTQSPQFADLRGSATPGSSTPAADNSGEGRAFDGAEGHRTGAGYPAGVERPADYPDPPGSERTGPKPATVALPLLDLDGINSHLDTILSKGRDWEYTGNTQLADINTFLPGELPTTGDNDGNQGATNTEVVVEGATATPQQPVTDPDAGDQPRSVTVPGDLGAPNYGPNGNDAARRAFLDHPGGSIAAIRAANAARGIYSQGNQYFTNIGGEAIEVSKDDYDSYRLGNISAQEFKNRYTADVASTLEPADSENTGNEDTEITPAQRESQGLPTSTKDEDDDN